MYGSGRFLAHYSWQAVTSCPGLVTPPGLVGDFLFHAVIGRPIAAARNLSWTWRGLTVLIEQKFTVRAPAPKVWDFLLDVPRMSDCVPGAEQVETLDDKSYRGTLKAKLGPISASFSGKMTIIELDPPHYLVARGEGLDARTASRATTHMTMRLREIGPGETEVVVSADVSMAGRLGRFGHGIMQEQARLLTEEFATCTRARLEADQAEQSQAIAVGELNVLMLLGRTIQAWFQRLWARLTGRQ